MFLLFTIVCANSYAGTGFAIKTVVIDAGHGGKDPGATGPGKTNEKDVALAVALKLGEYIKANFPDVNVIYTRKTDVFIELHERAEIANKSKADLFIAIHCNSTPTPVAYGTSTYVLGLHRTEANLEVAKRENSVILLEDDRDKNYDFDPNSPEGHIMMSMKQNAFLDQSIDIASKIEGQFEGGAKRKSLGVKQAGFYVLYKTTMPSILSEIGFISNPTEEKFLASEKGQELIANSLLKAFKDYKFEMENSEGEQFAYEEARRKSANNVDSVLPKTKKEAPVESVKKTTTTPKEEKPIEKKPEVTASTSAEPEMDYVTTAGGRKIRKPIDNASGGGVASVASKPVESPPVKKEEKPVPVTEHKPEPKPETVVKPEPKEEPKPEAEVKEEAKEEPKPKPEVHETKPAAEGKKVEPRNSGGATTAAEKPVKTAPAPKSEEKPTASVKPVKKTEAEPAPKPVVKTAPAGEWTFKVQIIALKTQMKASEVAKVTKAMGEITQESIADKGLIRFYAGESKTYAEAKRKLAIAAETGYAGAFIVGFKDGVRYGPEKLKQFENQ